MASVDDIDELIETRKLNGVDDGLYESERNDVNVDIKILKKWLHELDCLFEQTKINNTKERTALRNALAEREADKKRIKELEEYIFIAPDLDEMTAIKYANIQREVYVRGRADEQEIAEQIIYENYIPKQKVKDKIEELKQKAISYGHLIDRDEAFKIECEINVLEELLEEA